MATMVTRTLETKRERIIATLLLSLAIPCSAQMGVILALLAGNAKALWVFISVMAIIFPLPVLNGETYARGETRVLHGNSPLRWAKTFERSYEDLYEGEWYSKRYCPCLSWQASLSGLEGLPVSFDLFVSLLSYPVNWIGLPDKAAEAFLYGFFRRDFGAAGLYDLKESGVLSGIPLVVSVVTMALFMPCIAQLSITIKERGLKMALGMSAFIFPFAFWWVV